MTVTEVESDDENLAENKESPDKDESGLINFEHQDYMKQFPNDEYHLYESSSGSGFFKLPSHRIVRHSKFQKQPDNFLDTEND